MKKEKKKPDTEETAKVEVAAVAGDELDELVEQTDDDRDDELESGSGIDVRIGLGGLFFGTGKRHVVVRSESEGGAEAETSQKDTESGIGG